MAITASSITTSNTLEQLRTQFNNLVTDVSGLESGTLAYGALSATTTNTTTLNVQEDGTIVFEGATADAFETTLTVTDPTADRTVTLPNNTGTVITDASDQTTTTLMTNKTNLASGDVDGDNDLLLVVDASAGVFKKLTPNNLVSSAGGLTSVAADSTPQLGGDLDVDGSKIVSTSNSNVEIEPNGTGNVLLDTDLVVLGSGTEVGHITSSGAQDFKISTNSDSSSGNITITDGSNGNITIAPNGSGSIAVGNGGANATITSNGAHDLILNTNSGTNAGTMTFTDGANGNIAIVPNGSGKVLLDGDGSSGGILISDGLIDMLTGTGSVSKIKFYCESSNAHAQTLQAQPHSASSSAVLTLPVNTGTLIGTGDSGTVTGGMLATITTANKIGLAAIDIDGGTDIGAALTTSDLIIVDDGAGGTNRKATLARLLTLTDGNATALAIALG
jgi:hypothetical protein